MPGGARGLGARAPYLLNTTITLFSDKIEISPSLVENTQMSTPISRRSFSSSSIDIQRRLDTTSKACFVKRLLILSSFWAREPRNSLEAQTESAHYVCAHSTQHQVGLLCHLIDKKLGRQKRW